MFSFEFSKTFKSNFLHKIFKQLLLKAKTELNRNQSMGHGEQFQKFIEKLPLDAFEQFETISNEKLSIDQCFKSFEACYEALGNLQVKIVKTQWLTLDEWGCPYNNDPMIGVERPCIS